MVELALKLRRLRANVHSPRDLWLLLRLFALATVLPALLRALSLPRLLRWLTPRTATRSGAGMGSGRIARLAGLILRRDLWIYRPNCLKRSLLLYHFLRRAGYDVQFCMGVRPGKQAADERLDGHAWLEYRGAPFQEPLEREIPSYAVTYRFPEDGEPGGAT